MKPGFGRLLADAGQLARREADLIGRVAGLLVFLPAFAVQLLADPLPPLPAVRGEAELGVWFDAVVAWAEPNAFFHLFADLLGLLGLGTLAALLLDRTHPDVAGAIGVAARRFATVVVASLLAAVPIGLGLWLLLPGLYFQARLVALVPVLFAEGERGALGAIGRSVRLTRGHGFALLGAVIVLFLAQWLIAALVLPIDDYLRTPGNLNPVVLALTSALLALASSGYRVALLLLGVVAWRRWASSGT